MMFRRLRLSSSVALALGLLTAPVAAHDPGAATGHDHDAAHDHDMAPPLVKAENPIPLAIMGTIPVYWGEVEGGFGALISGAQHPHWARAHLEQDFALFPLDYLTPEKLAAYQYLLMPQPRGLTPEENVALDDWVRAGGRLLLLADPVMTGHSHYPIGDRRRPQDTALLSPILAHWGLELLFDPGQTDAAEMRVNVGESDSAAIPVNLAGTFALRDSDADCVLKAAEILAFCRIGEGQAVIFADAALLDLEYPPEGAASAFQALRDLAFAPLRADAGDPATERAEHSQTSENRIIIADQRIPLAHAEKGPEPPPDP